jgi:hypothetical protein
MVLYFVQNFIIYTKSFSFLIIRHKGNTPKRFSHGDFCQKIEWRAWQLAAKGKRRAVSCELSALGFKLRTAGCGLQAVGCMLPNPGKKCHF